MSNRSDNHSRMRRRLGYTAVGLAATLGMPGDDARPHTSGTHIAAPEVSPETVEGNEKKLDRAMEVALKDFDAIISDVGEYCVQKRQRKLRGGGFNWIAASVVRTGNQIVPAKLMESGNIIDIFASGITITVHPPSGAAPEGECFLQLKALPHKTYELHSMPEFLQARQNLDKLAQEGKLSHRWQADRYISTMMDSINRNPLIDTRGYSAEAQQIVGAMQQAFDRSARTGSVRPAAHTVIKFLNYTFPVTVTGEQQALARSR